MSRGVLEALPLETTTPDATQAFGRRLAAELGPGDVVALYGDLGAGKTHLVKGCCGALGVPEGAVSSPTFTLVNVYDAEAFPIYHLDAYRIKHLDEFFEMGYEEYFYGDGVCFVEWPERVAPLLPEEAVRLHLVHLGGNRRRLERR